jgi:hypothetical protein
VMDRASLDPHWTRRFGAGRQLQPNRIVSFANPAGIRSCSTRGQRGAVAVGFEDARGSPGWKVASGVAHLVGDQSRGVTGRPQAGGLACSKAWVCLAGTGENPHEIFVRLPLFQTARFAERPVK